jgi:lipopolysaccharide export system protein LptC
MVLSASWPPTEATAQGPAEWKRRRQTFQAARRHSRMVRRLRVLLPGAGVTILIALVIATQFSLPVGLDLAGARLSVTRNGIVMDNPHLTGFDRNNRQYALTADRAIQALTNPNAVRLEAIKARVSMQDRSSAVVTADSGDYDHKEQTLKLHGGVAVDSSDGYLLRMTGASIDLGAGTLASANPVAVLYEDSRTVGDSISVKKGGQIVVLQGNVRTTLMPPKRAQALAPVQNAPKD